jgi:vacuolar-type H+-ATPase subunit H
MAESGSRTLGPHHGPIGPLAGFLERFRRGAGVPSTVGGDASAELAPVFAALDEIDREIAAVRRRAEAAAARRLGEADEEAARIVAAGRKQAEAERDDALAAGLRAADADVDAILREAQAGSAALRRRGEARIPALVAEVLGRVLEADPMRAEAAP